MTELQLYKYINDNNIEWHWQDNDGTPDVLIFPYTFQLEGFNNMISHYDSDEGVIAHLKNGYACIWMGSLCEYFDIDINKVFEKK